LIGIKAGPNFHVRYFQLKGLNKSDRECFVERRKAAYTACVPLSGQHDCHSKLNLCRFGATTLALNLIPFAGLVFGFTSMAGAALWASDLEKKDRDSQNNAVSASIPAEEEQVVEM
jgi:hypothetical protein